MKAHKNQRGFTIVEAAVAFVVVSILGFTGYFVYHSRQATTNTLAEANKSSQAPADSTRYLTIKEWGVKIPLSAQTANITYSIKNASDVPYAQLALPSACADIGHVLRFTADTPGLSGQDKMVDDFPGAKPLARYYYGFSGPQGACTADGAAQAKVNATRQLLAGAVSHVKAQ